jgi:hypothetical protein
MLLCGSQRARCCEEGLLCIHITLLKRVYKPLVLPFLSSSEKSDKMVTPNTGKYMAPNFAFVDPLEIPYSPAAALVVSFSKPI